ncbi:MAG: 23S rRNA (guanosine(2251)-2'-O)-methyltransferase RlmB [Deltaproteobacteria bacterium]|nr:23S rRNA (guanosine(2251)-2'-O)-methyltransferase RlmB [Deltaproteobacteria bacterium]
MSRPRTIHGLRPVLELLRTRPATVEAIVTSRDLRREGTSGDLLTLARKRRVEVRHVSRREVDDLAGDRGHQGVVAILHEETLPQVEDPLELVAAARAEGRDPLLVLLDGIQDPGNLGALIRSAWALGADGVILPKDRASPLTPVAVKASAGAALSCPVVTVTNLARTIEQLEKEGVWAVAADLSDEAVDLPDARLDGPLAVVVGAEGKGLRRLVRERCSQWVKIPMARDFQSFNASVAGALILYEAWRQRRAISKK